MYTVFVRHHGQWKTVDTGTTFKDFKSCIKYMDDVWKANGMASVAYLTGREFKEEPLFKRPMEGGL